jgi:hypothetical protein
VKPSEDVVAIDAEGGAPQAGLRRFVAALLDENAGLLGERFERAEGIHVHAQRALRRFCAQPRSFFACHQCEQEFKHAVLRRRSSAI